MSVDSVRNWLAGFGLGDRVRICAESCATVDLAAQAIGVEPARIVKTLSFHDKDGPAGPRCILVAASGDARIDGKKFKDTFGLKSKMLPHDVAEILTGHAVGGVCPFDLEGRPLRLFLDASIRRFERIYPAAGASNAMANLSVDELIRVAKPDGWVDVCKLPEEWRNGDDI